MSVFFFFKYDQECNQLNISDRVVLIASRCRIVTVHNRTIRKFLGGPITFKLTPNCNKVFIESKKRELKNAEQE